MTSAHERVRSHIKSGKMLTQRQAIAKFKSYRLASHIERFRKEGLDIVTLMIVNKDGRGFHACYYLRTEK